MSPQTLNDIRGKLRVLNHAKARVEWLNSSTMLSGHTGRASPPEEEPSVTLRALKYSSRHCLQMCR